jgi:hypothetical protein
VIADPERERFEDASLLALKMEDRTKRQSFLQAGKIK